MTLYDYYITHGEAGMSTKISGEAMNKVYEMLKPMTVEQIRSMKEKAWQLMPLGQARLLSHQCDYALAKKAAGAW